MCGLDGHRVGDRDILLAASNLPYSSVAAGGSAEIAAKKREEKYTELAV